MMKDVGMSQLLAVVLELTILSTVYGNVITKYQYVPPPACPRNAVCSEIYASPSSSNVREAIFYNFVQCRCPTGLYCPSKPGPQTIGTSSNKWYGICQPVEELEQCQQGQIAEKIYVGAVGFEGKTFTQIECTCPQHGGEFLSDGSSTVWVDTITDDPAAKTIYQFMCNENPTSKRGRSRGRKFYFYRR